MDSDSGSKNGDRPGPRPSLVDSGWSLMPHSDEQTKRAGYEEPEPPLQVLRTSAGKAAQPPKGRTAAAAGLPAPGGGRTRPLESADEDELLDRALGNVGASPNARSSTDGLVRAAPPLPPPPPRPSRQASPPVEAPARQTAGAPALVPPPPAAISAFMEEPPTAPSRTASPLASPLGPLGPLTPELLEAEPETEPVREPDPALASAPQMQSAPSAASGPAPAPGPTPAPTPTAEPDKAQRAIPLWAVLTGGGAVVAVALGVLHIVGQGTQTPSTASTTPAAAASVTNAAPTGDLETTDKQAASAPPSPAEPAKPAKPADPASAEATAGPAETASPEPSKPITTAATPDSIVKLEQKTELTPDEALTLHTARAEHELSQVRALGRTLLENAAQAKGEPAAKLRAYALDSRTAGEALATMGRLKGPIGPDLLYEVWTGTPKRTEATTLAEALLRHPKVRAQASQALSVALDLRTVTECNAAKAAVAKATAHGDKRSLVPLNKLTQKRGCGPAKRQDCFACLREDKGKALTEAIKAVRARREPKY